MNIVSLNAASIAAFVALSLTSAQAEAGCNDSCGSAGGPPLKASSIPYFAKFLPGSSKQPKTSIRQSTQSAVAAPLPRPNPAVSNLRTWTGSSSPTTAGSLLNALEPFMLAARAAYGKTSWKGAKVTDWTVYASRLGLSSSDIKAMENLGFYAAVYEINGKQILAFRGSNARDWATTNIHNLFGATSSEPQYAFGTALAQAILRDYPGLQLAGHSLGGGIAAYAGATLGIPTVTFNPAGVKTGNISYSSNVLNLIVEGGAVNFNLNLGGGNLLLGPSIVIDQDNWSPQYATNGKTYWHGMDRFFEIDSTKVQFEIQNGSDLARIVPV